MSRIAGRGFIVGVGSNLVPERNVAAALEMILALTDQVVLSRIIYTAPDAVPSPQWFINLALFVPSQLSADELKQRFNQIEIALGRDRTHPDRKHRDRPVDLDILHYCHDVSVCAGWQVKERYLAPLVHELLAYIQNRTATMTPAPAAYIYIKDGVLGQTPTTVHRDHTSGLVRIV
jgi:2-amino-4-hydroxy-6-hydroxymethyldihydropteridine diphosphokinase